MTEPLHYAERPADGSPAGLLVLHHGRGSDERDLIGLGDVLDPERTLHVVAPRAPLQLPGSPGYHWYVVPRVGYPDPETFHAAFAALAACHDSLWARTGIEPARTVLGGFSMGAVMSYSLGLAASRPAVRGIAGFSGFVPVVERWEPELEQRSGTSVFVSHGRGDPVIPVEFAHRVRETVGLSALPLEYAEFEGGHWIDPQHATQAATWLGELMVPSQAQA